MYVSTKYKHNEKNDIKKSWKQVTIELYLRYNRIINKISAVLTNGKNIILRNLLMSISKNEVVFTINPKVAIEILKSTAADVPNMPQCKLRG